MKTLIISHNDPDGLFSAAGYMICETGFYEHSIRDYEKAFSNYDLILLSNTSENLFQKLSKFGFDINNYEKIVMLDYSEEKETMAELLEKFGGNFIWIDHHKEVYRDIERHLEINGLRDYHFSAATLVYKYFNKDAPFAARYVEDMDIWNFKLENTELILCAIDSVLKKTIKGVAIDYNLVDLRNVFMFLDDDYFLENKNYLIEIGRIINNHQKEQTRLDLMYAGKFMFEGYKTLVINSTLRAGLFAIIVFNNKNFSDIKQILVWSKNYRTNDYKFSIRSRKHDCNAIARKYGGHGHEMASGFRVKDISVVEQNLKPI